MVVTDSVRQVFVQLSDPGLAGEFVAYLRRANCVADVGEVEAHADGIAVAVEVPQAYDEDQARLEVHPGSGAELLPD
jgi:hypothetical protein